MILSTPILSSPAFKSAISAFAGAAVGILRPAFAPALLCTVLIIIDFLSAVALGRRLQRVGKNVDARLSSRRFGRVVLSLVKCYGALAVAALAQDCVIMDSGFDAIRCTAGAIAFWQVLSILENEATCSDARWAKIARRYLADKAHRHLGL